MSWISLSTSRPSSHRLAKTYRSESLNWNPLRACSLYHCGRGTETVGAVNLVGMLPETWGNLEPDPLQVFSIEDHIEMVRYELTSAGEVPDELVATDDAREKDEGFQTYNRLRQEGKRFLMIAPDHWFKYNISGSGSYEIAVPDPAADARLFLEWHHTTFVNYLRICFRWGGLPGLEHVSQVPAQDLATLTNDLLPL